MDSKEVLEREIADLEAQIRIRKAAIHALQRGQAKAGTANMRFYGQKPINAIRQLLSESGGRTKRKDLERQMVEGGILVGKKRGMNNIRISFEVNLNNQTLIEEGEYILLGPNARS